MQPIDVQQLVSREIGGAERLLWSGQPRQGMMFRPSDAVIIPFSIVWASFAVFWEASVWKTNAPWMFKIWGIPFVLIGLHLVIGRFFYDAWVRKGTVYGLTNQRVIIVTTLPRSNVRTIALRTVPELSLSESGDGSGTITLGPVFAGRSTPAPPRLEGIRQVRSVYDMITEAQRNAA